MILDKEKQKEFEVAARPLMKFLGDNFHPHVTAVIDYSSAELLEGVCSFRTEEYVKD